MLFLQPEENELNLVKEILRIFCEASGLITNIGKCSMTPIQCNAHHIETLCNLAATKSIQKPPKGKLHDWGSVGIDAKGIFLRIKVLSISRFFQCVRAKLSRSFIRQAHLT